RRGGRALHGAVAPRSPGRRAGGEGVFQGAEGGVEAGEGGEDDSEGLSTPGRRRFTPTTIVGSITSTLPRRTRTTTTISAIGSSSL
ncbi:hypothetical protein, partial [Enterococcus faecium]|uniref:hypothetical protein n=1 Tax=Enterococcus faecium TaxID=1352 RepID=UPI003DA0A3F7